MPDRLAFALRTVPRPALGRLAIACLAVLATACTGGGAGSAGKGATAKPPVVIYTSVDQEFAEPILNKFEADTGIDVQAVYDVEAAKTTGLVNRLLAEKDRPQADVWWSSEFAQTIDLANKGVLAPYASPAAADIPAQYKDAQGLWTGFGGRGRIILVNTDKVAPADEPKGLADLLTTKVPGDQIGLAYPLFGTASTQAAALFATEGADKATAFYQALAKRGIHIVDGNSVVRDMVASGQLAMGLTDTDDACGAVIKGAPVKIIVPDQAPGAPGTLVTPNTVALVKGGPHEASAKRLVDYLVSRDTEQALVKEDFIQLPLRGDASGTRCKLPAAVRGMDVGLQAIAAQNEASSAKMAEIFVR
jgi:iron(III) transport system substrate-binding protein